MQKTHSITRIASAVVSAWRFININGAHAASSADVVAISEQAAAVDKAFSAVTGYSCWVECAEAIAAGDLVRPAADGSGRAVRGFPGDACGRAMSGGAVGGRAEVRLVEQVGAVGAWNQSQSRTVGYENEQPGGITAPVTAQGKLVAEFLSGQWAASISTPTLTQGHTGWDGAGNKTGVVSRTGRKQMLKVVANAAATQGIDIQTPATNLLNKSTAGKVGLWVYLEGYTGGSLTLELSTSGSLSNDLIIAFNGNQLKEGWNFVVGVMRDFRAYQAGQNVTELHPVGVGMASQGTAANANIVASPLGHLRAYWNAAMNGTTMYFDSVWTGFAMQPQVVLGNDAGQNLLEIAAPIFDSYGWVGYCAHPFSVGGTPSDFGVNVMPTAQALYAKGWDTINHTFTHPSVGGLTAEADIVYELSNTRAWQYGLDMPRGAEFYAAPVGSASLLSEKVIKSMGFKLQRTGHGKQGAYVTAWGIDNPHNVGSIDMAGTGGGGVNSVTNNVGTAMQGGRTYSQLQKVIDAAVAYGLSLFPFWHGITTLGDDGSGESTTGDTLLIAASAFTKTMAYIRSLEQAGQLKVCRGLTGFYYGS